MQDSENQVRAAAYAIRDSLKTRLPAAEAATLTEELTAALERGSTGQEIKSILCRIDSTRVLLQQFLESGTLPAAVRGFQWLPGERAIRGTEYRCPEAGCAVTSVQAFEGDPVPDCPDHNRRLVPALIGGNAG